MQNETDMRMPARKLSFKEDPILTVVLAILGIAWYVYFCFIDQF